MKTIDSASINHACIAFDDSLNQKLKERQTKFDLWRKLREEKTHQKQLFESAFTNQVLIPLDSIYEMYEDEITSEFIELKMESHVNNGGFRFNKPSKEKPYAVITLDINKNSVYKPFDTASFLFFVGKYKTNMVRVCLCNSGHEYVEDLESYDTKKHLLEFSIEAFPEDELSKILDEYIRKEIDYLQKCVCVMTEYKLPEVDVFMDKNLYLES